VQQDLPYQGSGAAALADGRAEDRADGRAEGPPERAPEADAAAPADGRSWGGRHALDLRLSVPLVSSRYYLAVLGGRERRNAKRRGDERRRNPLATKWNIAFLAVLGLITGLALFAVIQFAARFVLETAGVA
jgi:hypothetical protein